MMNYNYITFHMFHSDKLRKAGRPRAIPDRFSPIIMSLHGQGYGYRAITRELKKQGLEVSWSTVRWYIKRQLSKLSHNGIQFCRNKLAKQEHGGQHREHTDFAKGYSPILFHSTTTQGYHR